MTDAEARERKPAVVFVDSSNRIVDLGVEPAAVPAGTGLVDGRLA
jgi:aspartate 1-decarboxylase